MSESIRILLVDDHRLFADALTLLVDYESDLRMVEVARTAEEALATTAREEPDVILVDISLPGMDGLEAIPRLVGKYPRCHVVVVTAMISPDTSAGAFAAGASAFIPKTRAAEELIGVIRRVAAG